MKYLKNNLIIISIITVAILLRFINLASIPVGFNDDEAAFGYNAYSILKTGMDEWGRFLPFPAFESFGDWKLVVYLYLTAISQFFFGMNEFATRFPFIDEKTIRRQERVAVVGRFPTARSFYMESK